MVGCVCAEEPAPSRVEVDAGADVDIDVDVDVDVDSDGDTDVEPCEPGDNCIDMADPAIPLCSSIGMPCRDARDCDAGFLCIAEVDGWPDGYCTAACDPDSPSACPLGSDCVWGGDDAGIPRFYCFQECAITDRNPWDTSSCGCRDGYQCDLLARVCVPGCATANLEDDCCGGLPGCSLTCNEDAFRCVNPGNPDANWGDRCTYVQDCPEEGACLDGHCVRFGCDLDGRGCEVNGGPDSTADNCRNLGTADDPVWLCVKTCNLTDTEGGDPFAPSVDCGSEMSCYADASDPDAVQNGFCWQPPRQSDVRERNMGGPCDSEDDCYSAYGQGICLEDDGTGWLGGTCTLLACDFPGMAAECPEPDFFCEPTGGAGLCLDRCTDPGGGVGPDVGCRDADYACYPTDVDGVGVCLPSCAAQPDPDAFCDGFFGPLLACDGDTGTCA
jgi:hypothetical protein